MLYSYIILSIYFLVLASHATSFQLSKYVSTRFYRRTPFVPFLSQADAPTDGQEEDDEEEVEPGKMRVSEIKAELELRSVSYEDCFDKESLVARLESARAQGLADPSILDKFNRQKLEENIVLGMKLQWLIFIYIKYLSAGSQIILYKYLHIQYYLKVV